MASNLVWKSWMPTSRKVRTLINVWRQREQTCLRFSQIPLQYHTESLCPPHCQLAQMHLALKTNWTHFPLFGCKSVLVAGHCMWATELRWAWFSLPLFKMAEAGFRHFSWCWGKRKVQISWNWRVHVGTNRWKLAVRWSRRILVAAKFWGLIE